MFLNSEGHKPASSSKNGWPWSSHGPGWRAKARAPVPRVGDWPGALGKWAGLDKKPLRISQAKQGRIGFFFGKKKPGDFEDQWTQRLESETGTRRHPQNWLLTGLKFVSWWVLATFPENAGIISCSSSVQPAAFSIDPNSGKQTTCATTDMHQNIDIYQGYLSTFINIYQHLSTLFLSLSINIYYIHYIDIVNIHPPHYLRQHQFFGGFLKWGYPKITKVIRPWLRLGDFWDPQRTPRRTRVISAISNLPGLCNHGYTQKRFSSTAPHGDS